MIDIRQQGYYIANDLYGNPISNHTTYHVALEKVINEGGGTITQPTVLVEVKNDNNKPQQGAILEINA